MPRLVYRAPRVPLVHVDDVRRMNDVLRGEDFFVDLHDINDAWTVNSRQHGEMWLPLPQDDGELLKAILSLLEAE